MTLETALHKWCVFRITRLLLMAASSVSSYTQSVKKEIIITRANLTLCNSTPCRKRPPKDGLGLLLAQYRSSCHSSIALRSTGISIIVEINLAEGEMKWKPS
jgi:hypothetical protein